MSAPTLAITGATGFVGQVLVRLAISEGWKVRALTRTPRAEMSGVTWVQGALDMPESLRSLANGSDAIIHVAGVVNAADKAGFEAGNVTGTMAMISAARAANVERFIHVSSLSAREPQLSNYGASKAKAETLVAASGLDWTIIRPPAVYGPGDKDNLDLFKMARFGFVIMPPAGFASWIEVSDLCHLLLAVVLRTETRAKLYEPDDGHAGGWAHHQFGKAVGWAMGKPVIAICTSRWVLDFGAKVDSFFRGQSAKLTADRASYMSHRDWVIDPDRRVPQDIWQPAVTTREGLKATAAAYRDIGWL